jgi:HEAT repeat protein
MRTNYLVVLILVLPVAGCGGGYREPQPPAMTELIGMLQSADPDEQMKAAAWVQQLGPKAAETTSALIAILKSPDPLVRQHSVMALGQIGPEAAKTAVPDLTSALSDSEYNVRRAAADALGRFGPAAASAIPELEKLGKQADPCNAGPSALKKIRS